MGAQLERMLISIGLGGALPRLLINESIWEAGLSMLLQSKEKNWQGHKNGESTISYLDIFVLNTFQTAELIEPKLFVAFTTGSGFWSGKFSTNMELTD